MFLGIGGDYVAIPWEALQTTAAVNMLVLEVDQETFNQAIQTNWWGTPQMFAQTRVQVDEYWQQAGVDLQPEPRAEELQPQQQQPEQQQQNDQQTDQ